MIERTPSKQLKSCGLILNWYDSPVLLIVNFSRSRHLDQLELIFAGENIPQVCVEGGRSANSLAFEFNNRFEALLYDSKVTQRSLNELQKGLSKLETEISFQRYDIM